MTIAGRTGPKDTSCNAGTIHYNGGAYRCPLNVSWDG